MAFDAAQRNGRFGCITSIPLQKDSESQSNSKVIPTRFLKIERRAHLLEQKTGERGMISRISR